MASDEMLLAIDNLRKKRILEEEEKKHKIDINLNIVVNGKDIQPQGQQVIPSPSA